MLGGTLDLPRAMRRGQLPPQCRAQRPHHHTRPAPAWWPRAAAAPRHSRPPPALDGVVVVELDARHRPVAAGEHSAVRRDRRVVPSFRISGRDTSQAGVMRAGQGQLAGRKASTGSRRRGRMASPPRAPAAAPRADLQRAGGQPRQRLLGGQHGHLHVDVGMPLRQHGQRLRQQMGDGAVEAREAHPRRRRCTSSSARSASASRRRARSTSVSPMAEGRTRHACASAAARRRGPPARRYAG